MDPNETYRQWTVALLEERADDARELYLVLLRWLGRGGFEPSAFKSHPFARRQFFQFSLKTGTL